jgi:hypothetical protein
MFASVMTLLCGFQPVILAEWVEYDYWKDAVNAAHYQALTQAVHFSFQIVKAFHQHEVFLVHAPK